MNPNGGHRLIDSSALAVAVDRKEFRAATGGSVAVLQGLTLSLGKGEVGALVGPSGCGKTTLLRIVAGLDTDYTGTVALPDHGRLGMVFQEPRLLPWRTVEQNVRLAAPSVTDATLDLLFGTLGLTAHRRHYPGELSLGLARRVALARAFAVDPDLLLLDEPFVSLDRALYDEIAKLFADVFETSACTAVLVTHAPEDAALLADRVIVLSGRPARIVADLDVPAPRKNRDPAFVAEFAARLAKIER